MAVFPANFLVASGTSSRSSPPVPASVGVLLSAENQIMTQIISHDPGVRSLFTSSVGDPAAHPDAVIKDILSLKALRETAGSVSEFLYSAMKISETELGAYSFSARHLSLPLCLFWFISDLFYRRFVSGKSTFVLETN